MRIPKSLPAYLSGTARAIAEVVGVDGAQKLADAFGGTEIRVSARASRLINALTPDQLKAFCHHFHNEKIYIPKLDVAKRHVNKQRAVALADQGKTRAQIALAIGMSERTIYKYLREAGANSDRKR